MPGDNESRRDERKSGSDVGGAYGNENTSGFSSTYTNPFNSPAWINFFSQARGGSAGNSGGAGVPAGSSTPPATVPPVTSAAAIPDWLKAIQAILGPVVAGLSMRNTPEVPPVTPSNVSPAMQGEMADLLAMMKQRYASTVPIHQAAMMMANRMAPAYARNGMTGIGSAGLSDQDPNKPNRAGATPVAQAMQALINRSGQVPKG